VKAELMDILCCPVCRGDLSLTVRSQRGIEIEQGSLRCAACREDYPIEDGIPNLLPPDERD
jgi:uncharacterized protein YbaR (Trm112 family)